MVLKQIVQEQMELLQQQHTEEYREAQSRSVRQTIVEEYGAEGTHQEEGMYILEGYSSHTGWGRVPYPPTAVNPGVNCLIPQLPP